ncbi:MAG: OmpA family protein [Myxococcota bacterium]
MTARTAITLLLSLLMGCATLQQAREAPGPLPCAIAGAVVGGVAGAVIGNNNSSDNPASGAAAGAGTGAIVGALICSRLVKQNRAPAVGVVGGPYTGTAPLTVALRADAQDPDGEIVAYAWDLGDGNSSASPSLSHTYRQPGAYTAQLTVTDDGGLTATRSVDITVVAPVAAPPPQIRRRVALGDLHFDFDSARLRPEADAALRDLLNELQDDSDLRVRISGHTDSMGPEIYNQMLSEARTKSVEDYLHQRGIDPSRVEQRGFGETRPLADNDSRDGRARNRRVVLEVID